MPPLPLAEMNLQRWLERIEAMRPEHIALGLERVESVALQSALADPSFPLITVTGTNGKGTTVAYIAGILRRSGYRVGVYTSPHFIDFNERIVVDEERIGATELVQAFELIESHRASVPLTYFEFTTLAAMAHFQAREVDVAVLEVGLGGRLDAVNCWQPNVACISTIGIDHIDWLGSDRAAIGIEKAGIARPGRPLVCGERAVPDAVVKYLRELGAEQHYLGVDYHVVKSGSSRWQCRVLGAEFELPMPAMAASWALDNAATAICASALFVGGASRLDVESLRQAMTQTRVPGRQQQVRFNQVAVVLDVAHNPQAAQRLAENLQDSAVSGDTRAVFGCLADKDGQGVVSAVGAIIDHWYVAELDCPRALPGAEAMQLIDAQGAASNSSLYPSVTEAFGQAVAQSGPEDRVVVFGSFFTVAAVLELLSADKS